VSTGSFVSLAGSLDSLTDGWLLARRFCRQLDRRLARRAGGIVQYVLDGSIASYVGRDVTLAGSFDAYPMVRSIRSAVRSTARQLDRQVARHAWRIVQRVLDGSLVSYSGPVIVLIGSFDSYPMVHSIRSAIRLRA
jgi:hypothetical protein